MIELNTTFFIINTALVKLKIILQMQNRQKISNINIQTKEKLFYRRDKC